MLRSFGHDGSRQTSFICLSLENVTIERRGFAAFAFTAGVAQSDT